MRRVSSNTSPRQSAPSPRSSSRKTGLKTVVIILVSFSLLILAIFQTFTHQVVSRNLQLQAGINNVSPLSSTHKSEQAPIPNAKLNIIPYNGDIKLTSHWCHSRDFVKEHGKRASCLFQNICIVPKHNDTKHEVSFLYVSDNDEQQDDESTSFTLGVGPHTVDNRVYFQPHFITPQKLKSRYPDLDYVTDLSVLFYEYNNENFGHMLNDVLLPIYSLLESFQLERQPANIFRYSIQDAIGWSCDFQATQPNRPGSKEHCKRFYDMIPHLVGGHSPVHVLNGTTIRPTCFERLAVGMPMYSDDCLQGSHGRNLDEWSTCNTGRQRQFWDFRNYLLENAGVSMKPPEKHKVVVTKRTDGRVLKNLDVFIASLENALANYDIEVVTVEWHKLSLVEQLDLARNATVHLTPPGGVSFIAMFLPLYATSIRLYSMEFGMEHHVFNYLAYLHNDYVDCTDDAMIPINDTVKLVLDGLQRYDTFRIGQGDSAWESHRFDSSIAATASTSS